MEDEDFLAAVEADNVDAPVTDEVPEEPVDSEPKEPEATQEEKPKAEEQPAPDAEVEKPKEPEAKPEAQHAPLAALLDERDRRKAAEAELAKFRSKEQPKQVAPDMFDDPDGYHQYQEQQVRQAIYQSNLQWSERIASIQHGDDTVAKAKEWGFAKCDNDPYFNAKVAASADPIGFVVQEYKRDQIASNIDDSQYQQFIAWQAAQKQLEQGTPAPTPSPAIPPKSLASAPSAGGVMTEPELSDEDIFAETFSRK